MIKVKRLIVGSLATNCFLVFDEKTKEAIIIDPGDDADYIERIIGDLDLKPNAIIATHGHYDHILAIEELKVAYQIPFWANEEDSFLLNKYKNNLNPKIDNNLNRKKKIKFGRNILKVIETPGHTPGSICLLSKRDKIIFVGDLIFNDGSLGRCDFSYSDKNKLKKSVDLILKLPDITKVYSGHGPLFNLLTFRNKYLHV